jgi:DNA-directed RNA polymerase subunit M/transcription elongation factor TFIIS
MSEEFDSIIELIFSPIGLSEEGIKKLSHAEFKDGTKILNLEDLLFIYDLYGYGVKYGEDKIVKYIEYLSTFDCWNEKISLTSPILTLEDIEEEQMNREKKTSHLKGIIKCKRCGSDKVQEMQRISRADEAAFVFIMCMNCNTRIK